MRTLAAWFLIASACAPKGAPGGSSGQEPPAPPAAPASLPEAPVAGEHACPDGAQAVAESRDGGQILRSCIIPGREYRNTPFRHGPYELVAADGRLRLSGAWRDNKEDGVWRFWHANGKLRRETTYRDGVPQADANWTDAGMPIDRRDGRGMTVWHANGSKAQESRVRDDGVIEWNAWFENGRQAKELRTRNGQQDGPQLEWFENGQTKEQADYRAGRLVAWKGWSSTGMELDDDRCIEDADCVVGVRNECYACQPPYEGITRWRNAERLMRPPTPPTGCDPGPFGCAGLGQPPPVTCVTGRCTLAGSP